MSTFFGIYDLNLVTSGCKDKYDGHKNKEIETKTEIKIKTKEK